MNEGAAKFLENAIFKQAGRAGINSNKGFVNGAKGMVKNAMRLDGRSYWWYCRECT